MTKTTLLIRILTLLLCALPVIPALAEMTEREKKSSSQAELISKLGLPSPGEFIRYTDENPQFASQPPTYESQRPRLGASVSAGTGIGEIVDNTYHDWQWFHNLNRFARHSLEDGLVDVHFLYNESTVPSRRGDTLLWASLRKTGYNVWNANDGLWPHGQEAGCLLQSGDSVIGGGEAMDIMPNGLVVFTACDNFLAKAQAQGWYTEGFGFLRDNHIYFQESRHSCFYDTGGVGSNTSHIEESLYSPGFLHQDSVFPTQRTLPTSVATQVVGNDTITHVMLAEELDGPWANGVAETDYSVGKYFRKLGGDYTGVWEEPQVIDTNWLPNYNMAASKWSAKVAVIWSNPTATGIAQGEYLDQDLFYRESTNGGVDWGPETNLTNYRRDTISATLFVLNDLLYDSQDRLHILWEATPTSMNPYRDGYFWGDYSTILWHWCDANPDIISKVADGNYTFEAYTQVCGFGGLNAHYIAWMTISECGGNLYCVYNQIHSKIPELGIELGSLDCSSYSDRDANANWEIFVTISSTMDGLLWDAPRNLTNTYTPGCDSANGAGGPCGNEYKPSMERYGLDETGLDLHWPGNAVIDPDTIAFGLDSAYDGNYFLNILYQDDEFPGSYFRRDNDVPTFNAMKWLRLACVDPIRAPQIAAEPRLISWTENLAWVKNGGADTITVLVTNDGNEPLDVSQIGTWEGTGSGWLSTSDATLAVPAGVPNTATFDVIVDASGLTYGLGNSSWLDGEIYLKSGAGNNDSLSIMVHFLAADSVEPINWDTAATSDAWDPAKGASATGDNTAISVGNWGVIGYTSDFTGSFFGALEANLDFFRDGGECRTDDRGKMYIASGSPYIIQHDGGGANLRVTHSATYHDGPLDQSRVFSFDPLVSSNSMSGGVAAGDEYDSVFTGPFANRDTTIIMERTFFAPRNNPDNPSFVVCKTVAYSGDGQAHDNVTIGSYTDWDIPSVKAAINTVSTSIPSSPAGQYVYMRGTDDNTTELNLICQVNANRYGAELFVDWHTNTEYNSDQCASNETSWGSWGACQFLAYDTTIDGVREPRAHLWYDSIAAREGVFANDTIWDMSIWVTYLFDYSIGAADTLTFYTIMATLHDGSLSDFEDNLVDAKSWYLTNIRGSACATCCTGETMGNVDCEGIVDIGDVTELIALLFIRVGDPFCCEAEADLDYNDAIDIGDLTILINRLFITVTDPPPCP